MSVDTSTEDELLVMNKSMFYMCPLCGYSDLHKGKIAPPDLMKKHMNYKNFSCTNDILQKIRLGHTFRTGVISMSNASFNSPTSDTISNELNIPSSIRVSQIS